MAKLEFYIKKTENIEDLSSGESFVSYEFLKVQDRKGVITMPRDQADSRAHVLRELKRKNAYLPDDMKKIKTGIDQAIKSEPELYVRYLPHVGWQKNRARFAVGERIFGGATRTHRYRSPLWAKKVLRNRIGVKGSLEKWKSKVAKNARYSTAMIVALAASFGAPLLEVVAWANFSINFYGKGKIGKSTVLLAATSTFGIGDELKLPNWNISDASFLQGARSFNGLIFPVNEMGLIKGRRGSYEVLRQKIYEFAEGNDTSRHTEATISTSADSSWFHSIAIYTAEHSVEELSLLAGERRDDGEYARLIEIPAARRGCDSVIDLFPETVTDTKRKKWARKKLRELRKACLRQHGTAIRPYMEFLINLGKDLPNRVRFHVSEFEKRHCEVGEIEPAIEHAVRHMAFLYAGGALAIEAGVLPWDIKVVEDAVVRCIQNIKGTRRSPEDFVAAGLDKLRKKLEVIGEKQGCRGQGPNECDGFYEMRGESRIYTIHAAQMRKWLGGVLQTSLVLEAMLERGWLQAKSTARPVPGRTEWAESSPRWPNTSSQRSFVFFDPFVQSG